MMVVDASLPSLISHNGVGFADAAQDILPRRSPTVGFLRHSPPQAWHCHFDQLRQWRSKQEPVDRCGDADLQGDKVDALKLPPKSPYVGTHRHAPPSPILCFSAKKAGQVPLDFFDEELEELSLSSDPAEEQQGPLPEDAWIHVLSMIAEVCGISAFAPVGRSFATLVKSELVWANKPVFIPPSAMPKMAPHLHSWLPAWQKVSKLIVPKSKQLIQELSEQMPGTPIEVAWRFDSELKGEGVEVVGQGRSVRRLPGAKEELVVLGDAPLPQTVVILGDAPLPQTVVSSTCALASQKRPYLEVTLDDRSAVGSGDGVNDFGIGVTAQPPTDIDELGAVADEVPLSWVVDFTAHSTMLSVNNTEAAKGYKVNGDDLVEGDRVGLLVTAAGTIEVYINGVLRDHLIPEQSERVPQGVELFPVLDLYGCTVQLSRTYADGPY